MWRTDIDIEIKKRLTKKKREGKREKQEEGLGKREETEAMVEGKARKK